MNLKPIARNYGGQILNIDKLIRVRTLLKSIVVEERHRPGSRVYSLHCRCAGICGSWGQLKPATVQRFVNDLIEEVRRQMKKRPQRGKLAGTNGHHETLNWNGLAPGWERSGAQIRPETIDIIVDEVTHCNKLGASIRVCGRRYWIGYSDIYDGALHPTRKDHEITVSLDWVKHNRIREYL